MEEVQQQNIFEDFAIDEEAKGNFTEIARWMNLNAITAFVSLGVSVIATVISFIRLSQFSSNTAPAATGGIVGLVITIAISLLLNIVLFQAADNIKKGITANDQGYFGIGLTKLASYFRILGILFIIMLVLCLLGFLFALLFAGSRGL